MESVTLSIKRPASASVSPRKRARTEGLEDRDASKEASVEPLQKEGGSEASDRGSVVKQETLADTAAEKVAEEERMAGDEASAERLEDVETASSVKEESQTTGAGLPTEAIAETGSKTAHTAVESKVQHPEATVLDLGQLGEPKLSVTEDVKIEIPGQLSEKSRLAVEPDEGRGTGEDDGAMVESAEASAETTGSEAAVNGVGEIHAGDGAANGMSENEAEAIQDADVEGEPELDFEDDEQTPTASPSRSVAASSQAVEVTPTAKGKKGKGKAVKARGKGGKVDKLKASAGVKKMTKKERDQSDSATPAPSVESYELHTPVPENREDSPADTSVYCICKKPYDEEDENTVMIGCDRCDNWFHPACVKIAPDQLEMIDQFICVDCEKKTTDRTVFKVKCRRPDCRRSVLAAASKYCSQACGMHHALAKLRREKLLFDDVYPAIAYAALPEPVKIVMHSTETIPVPTGPKADDLSALLSQIALQEDAVAGSRRIIEARKQLLDMAIANADALQPGQAPIAVVEEEVGGKSKKKKKKQPAVVDDRACGYDSRLAAADGDVVNLLDESAEHDICSAIRRCDRHQGWQRTIAVALDVEMALIARRQDQLAEQTTRIKSGIERKIKAKEISQEFRAVKGLQMDVDP